MSVLISVKEIYKTYKVSSGNVFALNGITFDFEKKDFTQFFWTNTMCAIIFSFFNC